MIRFLIKRTIKDSENVNDKKVRSSYHILSGVLGIICNFFLFVLKFVLGLFINSISVISDALNNLTDLASSTIGILGTKLSNKKPDRNHPYGHGRIEYITSLIISFLIIFTGAQLFISSIEHIRLNTKPTYNLVFIIILGVSILVKLWMFFYNHYMSKKINSLILKSVSYDSLGDVLATSVVVVGLIFNRYINFSLDGVIGIMISLFIVYNGIKITIETSKTLLGKQADDSLIKAIELFSLNEPGVLGIHDLLIHDYGPGRMMASMHVEVSASENIVKIHELIDNLETKIYETFNINMVIHMDPVAMDDSLYQKLHQDLMTWINEVNKDITFHDLRIINQKITFDLSFNYQLKEKEKNEFITYISNKIKENYPNCELKINSDYH